MDAINQFRNLNLGQIGPISKVNEGLYSAEAKAPTGETVYFAMEKLGEDRKKWNSYINAATFLVFGGDFVGNIGSLTQLGSRIHDEIIVKEFLATCIHPHCTNYWTEDKAKFEMLSAKLRERKIVDDSPRANELKTIPYASSGINVSKQTHMVYVSKLPILDRANFDVKGAKNAYNFGTYVQDYGISSCR